MAPGRRAGKQRADMLLTSRGLASSRAQAQALILAGRVRSGPVRVDKPGMLLPSEAPLEVAEGLRYVGRGGHKLAGALGALGIQVRDRDALDVGASTGGFTQVLLEAGARRVIALDVGRGQLDWGLREDPRVTVLEGINARYLQPNDLPFLPSLAVVDVSFISLAAVLPAVVSCLVAGGEIVALVKPQFEVGRGRVGRGGIVRDPALHFEVLRRLVTFAREHGWGVAGAERSSLVGAEGNVEFFLHLIPSQTGLDARTVEDALKRAVGSGGGQP
jgi:23S rRNA (cytidine1920-2'-O)/16S rRNA (cytidine1409-2'-O)-methyltransferase